MRGTGRDGLRVLWRAMAVMGAFMASRMAAGVVFPPRREQLPLWACILIGLAATVYFRLLYNLRGKLAVNGRLGAANKRVARSALRITGFAASALCCGLAAHAFALAFEKCAPVRGAYWLALLLPPGWAALICLCRACRKALSVMLPVTALAVAVALALVIARNRPPPAVAAPDYANIWKLLPAWLMPALASGGWIALGCGCADGRGQCRLSACAGLLTGGALYIEGVAGRDSVISSLCGYGAGGFAFCALLMMLCAASACLLFAFCARALAENRLSPPDNGRIYN